MDALNKRVEQLEQDTHQIRIDVATLTERSKNFATTVSMEKLIERCDTFATKAAVEKLIERCDTFATKAAVEKLIERCDNFVTRAEFTQTLHSMEIRLMDKMDGLGVRINSVESKIFWGIFLPAMSAVIGWFVSANGLLA